MKEKVKRIEE